MDLDVALASSPHWFTLNDWCPLAWLSGYIEPFSRPRLSLRLLDLYS
jgi:hypothetical protein